MTGFLDNAGGDGVAAGGYTIDNSLRFRASASAYLSRTITTDATSTYFAAVKRGRLGVISPIFGSSIKFNANDTLTAFGLTTTAVFRDPTSWLFIHVSNGGLYVNGASYGAVTTSAITNPRIGFDGTNYFDGYIARCGVVGGVSSAYTNFGYLNTEINEWVSKSQSQVKAVVDAGGANSFMLDFDDATSLTTLGYDKSSKGNNWTCNNISLTAGVTYDHMLDVPGNSFAVLNPLQATSLINANLTFLDYGITPVSTFAVSSGKWYMEICHTTMSIVGGATLVGIIRNWNLSGSGWSNSDAISYISNATKNVLGSSSSYGATFAANDIIGIAFDIDNGAVEFYKNGVSQGSISQSLTGYDWKILAYSTGAAGNGGWAAFGQAPLHASATYHADAGGYFRYAPPTGSKALCQANLPDPAIINPKEHFDIKTRTGTGASANITRFQFQPDLVWTKSRGRAVDHALFDAVRGVQKMLESNQTGAESTEATGLTAFNSDGYTIGALDQINGTTATNSFVDWVWKAGGAGVSNTDGSITSTVSANVEAGFSIVTYTGTGANATVGHGLGVAPKMVIVKQRSSGTTENWAVYHAGIASDAQTDYILLNSTAAAADLNTYWNDTAPTTTVFSIGTANDTNESTKDFVAYCFAEILGFSKFGSYTGNGSADGPFVYCGFRPRYVIVKRVDSAENWYVHDAARDTYNQVNTVLCPNLTNAEDASNANMDFTSSGFKIRESGSASNTSGGTYIFAAFADVSAKFSNAR
jgi:hypothetical protein